MGNVVVSDKGKHQVWRLCCRRANLYGKSLVQSRNANAETRNKSEIGGPNLRSFIWLSDLGLQNSFGLRIFGPALVLRAAARRGRILRSDRAVKGWDHA